MNRIDGYRAGLALAAAAALMSGCATRPEPPQLPLPKSCAGTEGTCRQALVLMQELVRFRELALKDGLCVGGNYGACVPGPRPNCDPVTPPVNLAPDAFAGAYGELGRQLGFDVKITQFLCGPPK